MHPHAQAAAAPREALIDTLRGLALFGILLVNIQAYTWGVTGPTLGVITELSTVADKATVLATALVLEYKVYPIFCFCFGYGFATMARRWAWQAGQPSGVDREDRFRRRMRFLLWAGTVHGVFIWFGDVLSRYALAAWFIAPHIGARPKTIIKQLRFWAMVLVGVTAFSAVAAWIIGSPDPDTDNAAAARELMDAAFETYVYGGLWAQCKARLSDYLIVMFSWLFVFPQAVLLFLLGALVCQLGWLRHPQRFLHRWKAVARWSGVIGIPLALAFTWHAWHFANHSTEAPGVWAVLVLTAAPTLSAAYVAVLAINAHTPLGNTLARIFAPAGRMALTNYLAQSVLMGFVMSAAPFGVPQEWRLGLGVAERGQFVIALAACGIFAMQLVFSHYWMSRHAQGPMEMLWRRYTYR
jgi:uncharacterized protein